MVVVSVFVYFMITWSILRFFQMLYKIDHRMRMISSTLFEERTNLTS